MTWQLIGREYIDLPYKLTPVIRGWDLWIADGANLRRIGRELKTLRAGKALATLHAKGDKRVPQ
jgi:hypothetical protein